MNINRALKESEKSDHKDHKHATLLFRGGALCATGYNQGIKHSEIMALNRVKHKGGAKNMTAVNVRVTKSGIVGISKPCKACEVALRTAGVRTVIYTSRNGDLQTEQYR